MTAPVRTRRKNAFNIYREAEKLASFDEFPMLRPEVDPQVHLSKNDVDQPFHLACEKDTVLAQMSGKSRVIFADGSVRFFDLVPGEFAYVPAGYAHRILTVEPGAVIRYKAQKPGNESIIWYCSSCDAEVHRFDWQADEAPVQQGYVEACQEFNADVKHRTCGGCGTELPPVDLTAFRWDAISAKLLEADDE
ncbi:hypothetical protein [Novosphingobium sp. RL4]|uniref:hypothetical protein n=1 Tax=Novosphingobium sp. RL4 TaxID=3109595 RepID=UPI002D782183|nr:hypothetical protein [Novosphingobium sp. RL4]WRT94419.1 hypothetical protein U9J33_07935 [Novosphingobium sp. RL4]